MTKGRGKNIKKRAGNQAGNRSSTEEEESSKQLEEEKEENMQTGTVNEAGNKRGPGRPWLPLLSAEVMEIKREEKRKKDRDYRANKKCKFVSLQKLQELVIKFCEKHEITEEFNAFFEMHEEKV
ncbi:hypothetical protein SLEP1_g28146 [Rubroshorea leprosula]|uniref:Uncharacterized protein n=1 Tax=Rubroshorea leprosula TaxID=152421 RepID=A0AAV5K243_9ROSI|nr:hypothetical protein SLEP1_g28146 [Rubroshorea leprosula]